ncbi:MAG: hypothetical protein RR448_01745 [Niameybacter sp.]|uniref:hypothetical protein n=1 Tax=Niameybacter sp. TaxID=2033640 RepID=UPI002FC883E9
MKHKILGSIIFVTSLISLIISMKLFWNMGIFVDEYNLSPDIVYGGNLWLTMSWLRMGLLLIATVASGISLVKCSVSRRK